MTADSKPYEHQLYEIWKNQCFSSSLKTKSGEDIQILDIGTHNTDSSGADFKNSRIRVGNLTYIGDIEIDVNYNDWKTHGHNIDNKYNKVVLHATFINKFHQAFVYTKDGRKVPSICLADFLEENIIDRISNQVGAKSEPSRRNNYLKCNFNIENITRRDKEKFVTSLGVGRFKKKCTRIFNRLKELTYLKDLNIHEPVIRYDLTEDFQKRKFTHADFHDRELWEQLLYELIFEALGYSKNKTIMLHLAQSADLPFLRKLGNDQDFIERTESTLVNIGGIKPKEGARLDNETIEYLKALDSHWDIVKRIYDGKLFDEAQWHFFKLRPQNFPTIRIAGGTRFLRQLLYGDLIETMIKKIKEIRSLSVLINSIRSLYVIKSDGYWQRYYIFDKPASAEIKYFVGASRADEMVINVILPFFSVYFEIFGNAELAKKILTAYTIYNQRAENKIVRDVAESLNMTTYLKKTVYQQGMIELFRSYCSKGKCLECEIGKVTFS